MITNNKTDFQHAGSFFKEEIIYDAREGRRGRQNQYFLYVLPPSTNTWRVAEKDLELIRKADFKYQEDDICKIIGTSEGNGDIQQECVILSNGATRAGFSYNVRVLDSRNTWYVAEKDL